MSAAPSHKSHASAWIFAVLFVPVAYLASVPPVIRYTSMPITSDIHEGAAMTKEGFYLPLWAAWYSRPYMWLCHNTPLEDPLRDYLFYWY